MKKLLRLFLFSVMFVGILGVKGVSAEESVLQLQTSYVPDVSDAMNTGVVSYSRNVTGEITQNNTSIYYMTFTLDSDCYVEIGEMAKIWEYNFNGEIKCYLSASPDSFTNEIISMWGNGSKGTFKTLLTAGTYYIKQDVIDKGGNGYLLDDEYFEIYVKAQRVTGVNGTLANPAKIQSGVAVSSYLSKDSVKRQIFEITLPSTGSLEITSTLLYPPSWYGSEPPYSPIKYNLCNTAGQSYKSFSGNGKLTNVAAGTYLIMCDEASSNAFRGYQFNLLIKFVPQEGTSTIVTGTPTTPAKPTLIAPTLKFKSKKSIKGNTYTKGCKVYVKVGKKTYTKVVKKKSFTIKLKSKLKNGQKIKVWATKKGYKNSPKRSYKAVIY